MSSAQNIGSSRSFDRGGLASRCAELITSTAWNLKPTGRGFMLRMPARKRPASRSRYESPPFRCPTATSSARSRGVSSIQRTTGSISGRNRTASGPTSMSAARAGVIILSPAQSPRPAPNPIAEADCRNRRRRSLRSIVASLKNSRRRRARTQSPVSLGLARLATGESSAPASRAPGLPIRGDQVDPQPHQASADDQARGQRLAAGEAAKADPEQRGHERERGQPPGRYRLSRRIQSVKQTPETPTPWYSTPEMAWRVK